MLDVLSVLTSYLRPGPFKYLGPSGLSPLVKPVGHQPTMSGKTNKTANHRILWRPAGQLLQ